SAKWPLAVNGESLAKNVRATVGSGRSCHSIASARRRMKLIEGQLGLLVIKAAYRAKLAPLSSLRRIAHSTSLRATGSLIDCLVSVACEVFPWRARATALLTWATSAAE